MAVKTVRDIFKVEYIVKKNKPKLYILQIIKTTINLFGLVALHSVMFG